MIDELRWQYLTGLVNNLKSPNRFLTRLLMKVEQTLPVETIRIESIVGNGRQIAPFVRKNGEAIMVPGYGAKGYSVDGPNIRLKRPFTPSDLLWNRQPGQANIFAPTGDDVLNAVDAHLAQDSQVMEDMIVNAEEYLTGQMLQGQIQYQQEDEEVIQITFAKPSANNITMSVFLDDATPANIDLLGLIRTAKGVIADAGAPQLTDAIVGSEVAAALDRLMGQGLFKWLTLNGNNTVSVGTYTFIQDFSDDGVLFLGEFGGLRWWSYPRSGQLPNGTNVNMIRPKYIEFVSTSPATQRVMYYAAIPDMKLLRNRTVQAKRFSKSWEQEDPSAVMQLLHSRPLPVPRRADAGVSVKAISGQG